MLCILNVGTVPMLYILYVGTVPTFRHSLKDNVSFNSFQNIAYEPEIFAILGFILLFVLQIFLGYSGKKKNRDYLNKSRVEQKLTM